MSDSFVLRRKRQKYERKYDSRAIGRHINRGSMLASIAMRLARKAWRFGERPGVSDQKGPAKIIRGATSKCR